MKIPFLDLRVQTNALRMRLDDAYRSVMDSGVFVQGAYLATFEAHFARYCEAHECVGVGNGLDALSLILQAYHVGPGDEVLVPSNSCIATWLAVSAVGAHPVPVEPNPRSWNLCADAIETAITSRTRAVIVVHLYGQCAEMHPIMELGRVRGIKVIEDAAQAAGGRFAGRPSGSLGDAAGFSFFPTKNLGAFGDGGAVLTSDSALADRVRKLGSYGGLKRNEHDLPGRNSRLDELQAAFLEACLPMLEEQNDRRRHLAGLYQKALEGSTKVGMQEVPPSVEPTWHLFAVRIPERQRVRDRLQASGIGTAIHYPKPPNLCAAYNNHRLPPQPFAETLSREILSLPLHPYLTEDEVRCVSETLLEALE